MKAVIFRGTRSLLGQHEFDYSVRLNLPVLGPKYGSEVARIQRALTEADRFEVASAVLENRPVRLGDFELQPSDLLVTAAAKPGYAVAEEAGYAVAVTTEITPALADEGLARELVRRIQEMRKSAGLEIADHIRLFYAGDAGLDRVMRAHGNYIRQETLAEAIGVGVAGGYVEEHEVDGRKVTLALERAG